MTEPDAELDCFLDHLVAGTPAVLPRDATLEKTARRVHAVAIRHLPERSFASDLRASLLAGCTEQPLEAPRPHLPVRFTSLRVLPGRRVGSYAELAALLLILVTAVWVITRPESRSHSDSGSDGNSSFVAVGTSTATNQPARTIVAVTPYPTKEVVTEFLPTPGPITGTATPVPPAETEIADVRFVGREPGKLVITLFGIDLAIAPSSTAATVIRLAPGTLLIIDDAPSSDGTLEWLPVVEPTTNQQGWVPSVTVGFVNLEQDRDAGGTIVVTLDEVNFREDHAYDARVIAVLQEDHALIVTGDAVEVHGDVWLPVRDPVSGEQGWIVSDYMTVLRNPTVVDETTPSAADPIVLQPTIGLAPTQTATLIPTAPVP